jgi:hypothetical protein
MPPEGTGVKKQSALRGHCRNLGIESHFPAKLFGGLKGAKRLHGLGPTA